MHVKIDNPMVTDASVAESGRPVAPPTIPDPLAASAEYRPGDFWDRRASSRVCKPGAPPALSPSARPLLFGGLEDPRQLTYAKLKEFPSHFMFMMSIVTGELPSAFNNDMFNEQIMLPLSAHGCRLLLMAFFPLTYYMVWASVATCTSGRKCLGTCVGVLGFLCLLFLILGDLMYYVVTMTFMWPIRCIQRKFVPITGCAWVYLGCWMPLKYWKFGVLLARMAYRSYLTQTLEELQAASTLRARIQSQAATATAGAAPGVKVVGNQEALYESLLSYNAYLQNKMIEEWQMGLAEPCANPKQSRNRGSVAPPVPV